MNQKILIGCVVFVLGALTISCACKNKTKLKSLVVVSPFDSNKYLGKWYEVARLDNRFERDMNNTTAEYSLNDDGSIKVVNRGYNYVKKKNEEAVGKAKFAGSADKGKLKVSFFGPFYGDYNLIAIDNDYKYALVAGKNTDYLWLLSRDINMPEEIKESYLKKAQNLGYDTSKLIWVEHNN